MANGFDFRGSSPSHFHSRVFRPTLSAQLAAIAKSAEEVTSYGGTQRCRFHRLGLTLAGVC